MNNRACSLNADGNDDGACDCSDDLLWHRVPAEDVRKRVSEDVLKVCNEALQEAKMTWPGIISVYHNFESSFKVEPKEMVSMLASALHGNHLAAMAISGALGTKQQADLLGSPCRQREGCFWRHCPGLGFTAASQCRLTHRREACTGMSWGLIPAATLP